MESKVKEDIVPDAFLTTDPKLILRKPRPFAERHSAVLKIAAAIAGGCLALLVIWRIKRFM